ncbi:4-fold beta flower protein [Kitasatospora sp. NPDC057936]|uniref:4-fold beta flower protein n=1 Tax=Kitasatospora sp. NPDC057936 TaxID=3346283 RepID=UPI0036D8C6BB
MGNVYDANHRYVGSVQAGVVYDANHRYVGSVQAGVVYDANHRYVGSVVASSDTEGTAATAILILLPR